MQPWTVLSKWAGHVAPTCTLDLHLPLSLPTQHAKGLRRYHIRAKAHRIAHHIRGAFESAGSAHARAHRLDPLNAQVVAFSRKRFPFYNHHGSDWTPGLPALAPTRVHQGPFTRSCCKELQQRVPRSSEPTKLPLFGRPVNHCALPASHRPTCVAACWVL